MPTTASTIFSGNARLDPLFEPDEAAQMQVTLQAPTSGVSTLQRGTVLGEITPTSAVPAGTYKPYAAGNTDGSQTARALLVYTVTVDSSGNIWLGDSAGGQEFGQKGNATPVFVGGGAFFRTQDLVGLDANAITNMGAALVEGSTTSGILRF